MVKGEKTALTKASKSTYSLRTTVPTGIVKHFDLTDNDFLIWNIETTKKGKMYIIVAPERGKNKNPKIR